MKRHLYLTAILLLAGGIACNDDGSKSGPEPPLWSHDIEASTCDMVYPASNGEGDTAEFLLCIGTAAQEDLHATGAGELVRLALHAPVPADPEDPDVILGEYLFDAESTGADMTFTANGSYRELYEETGGGTVAVTQRNAFRAGRAVIAPAGDDLYTVEAELTFDNGKTMRISYAGALAVRSEVEIAYDIEIDPLFCEFNYWGDFYNSGNDNCTLYIGTAEHFGAYVSGPGEMIMLSLQAPRVEDYRDADIVPGAYHFDPAGTYEDFTIVGHESVRILYEPDADEDGYMEETSNQFTDGYARIRRSGDGWQVKVILTLDDGQTMCLRHEGPATFTNRYAAMIPDMIEEDKRFECGWASITYEGGGAYTVDMMAGEDDPSVTFKWTDRDRVMMYIGAEEDPTRLAPGTYTVGDTQQKGYVMRGGYQIEGNSSYSYGSKYLFMDGNTWEEVSGFMDEGTVVIEERDGIYTVTVDVTDTNGHKIETSFEGPVQFVDNTAAGQSARRNGASRSGKPARIPRQ